MSDASWDRCAAFISYNQDGVVQGTPFNARILDIVTPGEIVDLGILPNGNSLLGDRPAVESGIIFGPGGTQSVTLVHEWSRDTDGLPTLTVIPVGTASGTPEPLTNAVVWVRCYRDTTTG